MDKDKCKGCNNVKGCVTCVDGSEWAHYHYEEPASDGLEDAANKYGKDIFVNECMENGVCDSYDLADAFKAGAKWQVEQFEKNRLKHCNSITNEQAELEQGFIDQHLDKHQRMPTFLDAIEYGMKLMKEQMMKSAVECYIGANKEMTHKLLCFSPRGQKIALDDALSEIRIGDKVRVIIIKEENMSRFGTCPYCGGLLEYYDPVADWYKCVQCGKVTSAIVLEHLKSMRS